MWNVVILIGGLLILIVGILMVINGNQDGWQRIGTGVTLVLAWFALRRTSEH